MLWLGLTFHVASIKTVLGWGEDRVVYQPHCVRLIWRLFNKSQRGSLEFGKSMHSVVCPFNFIHSHKSFDIEELENNKWNTMRYGMNIKPALVCVKTHETQNADYVNLRSFIDGSTPSVSIQGSFHFCIIFRFCWPTLTFFHQCSQKWSDHITG